MIVKKELENKKRGKVSKRDNSLNKILELNNHQQAMDEFERRYLQFKINEFNKKVTNTAKNIGLDRSTIYKKFKKLGIEI